MSDAPAPMEVDSQDAAPAAAPATASTTTTSADAAPADAAAAPIAAATESAAAPAASDDGRKSALSISVPGSTGAAEKKNDDDDDEEEEEEEEDDAPMSPKRGTKEEAALQEKLARAELKSRSEAKKTHDAELKRLREVQNAKMAASGARSAEARLHFLAEQTDVFARFMTGAAESAAAKKKPAKDKGAKGTGARSRKTEEEEDVELLQASIKGKALTRLTAQPACIAFGQMRPYQIEGLNWMINLYEQGINGILADEMGLGKTLQTISLLGYLKNDRGVSGPHIVIVPKSVLGNWQRELARWCPSLRVVRVHGNAADRAQQIKEGLVAGEFDVVVTTYEVVRIERAAFLKFNWRYLIMDEAHSIKNEQSRLALTVRELDAEFRLLITGTPLQNNLKELWALLNFLLPEVFGDSEVFEDFFKIENMAEDSVVSKLHAILRPFMLRRLKADVEASLPAKREIKLFTGMTEMQTYWYKTTLSKDVAALNQLGGPDRTRLHNILMQLRKVCNHPYLFQGAEPGPPYFDGPHLWENAGKMLLLDKLLTRLKANGDRVLIFSQMTRLLDILEDYMRLKGYQYCRIDGSTSGEDRDKFMAEYNEPGSSKFVFLLSTRAGGLGINLQTANIVILYDSDWNPQMDLQAQDRAHRIGQKKEVIVFRFVTEGTVEEKIVERAEKKLYLDAVVVQQGRLQAQNKNLNKDELMTMVKFGAEAIFKTQGATVTDEDIDLILERGKKRTEESMSKFQHDAQHNLLNFRLDDGGGTDTYMFDGENYRGKSAGNFIALPQRARKKNYDVNEYYREALNTSADPSKKKDARLPKGLTMHDFQFFRKDRIEALEKQEHELLMQRRALQQRIRDAKNDERSDERRANAASRGPGGDASSEAADAASTAATSVAAAAPDAAPDAAAAASSSSSSSSSAEVAGAAAAAAGAAPGEAVKAEASDVAAEAGDEEGKPLSERLEEELALLELPAEEKAEKEALVAEGFGSWNRRDFRAYCQACERHGRDAKDDILADVAEATGKSKADVAAYHAVFWKRYKEVAEHERILDRVKKGEQKLAKRAAITKALDDKVARTANPWQALTINYGANKGKTFTDEEDRFLVCMLQRLGYGAWEQLKQEIRKAWNFRFDWFLKSRSAPELQRRCDTLVRLIEKEMDDEARRNPAAAAAGANKRKAPAAAAGASGKKKPAAAAAVDDDADMDDAASGAADSTAAKKRRRKK